MADGVFQAFRETCFHLLHLFLDLFCHRQGVGSGRLINANNDCGFSVETTDLLIDQRAQLDPRNILQPHRRAVCVLTNDNVAEFFCVDEPAWNANRIGKLLAFGSRLSADLSCGIYRALLLNSVRQVETVMPELGELVRLDPDSHCIIRSTEVRNLPDARNAQ